MSKKRHDEYTIKTTEPIKLKGTDDRDDYIDFRTIPYHNCVNCGKDCHPRHIEETNDDYTINHFCGLKCIVDYYTKELKKEAEIET